MKSYFERMYPSLVGKISKHDTELINKALVSYWTDINENDSESPEVQEILHEIKMRGYHYEEYDSGLLSLK